MMKIKSFLEDLEAKEKANEQKLYKKNHARGFSTRMHKKFFEHPIYQPLNEIIICKNPLQIIPKRWEELSRNFDDIAIRHYELCTINVLKISNIHNYKTTQDEYSCIAIPMSSLLYSRMYQEYKTQIDLYIFIQMSRRIIQDTGYDVNRDIKSCNSTQVLKSILSDLLSSDYIKHSLLVASCYELNINLEELLSVLSDFHNDNELSILVLKINDLLEKYYVNQQ